MKAERFQDCAGLHRSVQPCFNEWQAFKHFWFVWTSRGLLYSVTGLFVNLKELGSSFFCAFFTFFQRGSFLSIHPYGRTVMMMKAVTLNLAPSFIHIHGVTLKNVHKSILGFGFLPIIKGVANVREVFTRGAYANAAQKHEIGLSVRPELCQGQIILSRFTKHIFEGCESGKPKVRNTLTSSCFGGSNGAANFLLFL